MQMDVSLRVSRGYLCHSRVTNPPFPQEILLMILGYLGYNDLLKCSRVCKMFCNLVNNAWELVYVIELFAAGFVGSPLRRMPIADCLHMLRDMRSRWALFKPFKRETISHSYLPKRLAIFDVYAGGLFAQAVGGPNLEDKIEFISRVALPGRTRPLRDLGAVIPDITRKQETFVERTFHFQPEIDLVVFFERYSFSQLYSDSDDSEENTEEEDERTVIRMVFRTMSSGTVQPHPACRVPNGVIEFVHKDACEAYSHVHGDAFGVAFLVYELIEIVIWNWHSGECLMHMTHNDIALIWDFAFLSSRIIVVGMSRTSGSTWCQTSGTFEPCHGMVETLSIFSFGGTPGAAGRETEVTTGTVTHLVSLCLPKAGYDKNFELHLSTGPSCFNSYGLTGMPFNAYRRTSFQIFVVDITPTMDEDAPGLCLVVHGLALCKWGMWAFRMHKRNTEEAVDIFVPWEDWGPGYSRLFTVKPLTYIENPPHRSIVGERIALQIRDKDGKDTAYVLDFNLRAHKRALSTSSNGSAVAVAFGPTTYISPGFFDAPVTTSLPYTAVKIPDHEQYYGFMLDEERLLCMKPGGIDVLVF